MVVATMLRWSRQISTIDVEALQRAERAIIRLLQSEHFKDAQVRNKNSIYATTMTKRNALSRLDPFLDEHGIIRVGGRLQKANVKLELMHPIILPKKFHTTRSIIRWYHQKVRHAGRGATLNEIRSRGFWVVNGASEVRYIISTCVTCRHLRGMIGEQKMSDLPADRVNQAPPFTYVGVDMFGPFRIKDGRKELKRYGALFTCLACRAVHLESTNSLDTNSFIQALRRFLGRRGPVRLVRCDNGTNFIGAENEVKRALEGLDGERIRSFLLETGADWIEWKHNPPAASHFGGEYCLHCFVPTRIVWMTNHSEHCWSKSKRRLTRDHSLQIRYAILRVNDRFLLIKC